MQLRFVNRSRGTHLLSHVHRPAQTHQQPRLHNRMQCTFSRFRNVMGLEADAAERGMGALNSRAWGTRACVTSPTSPIHIKLHRHQFPNPAQAPAYETHLRREEVLPEAELGDA